MCTTRCSRQTHSVFPFQCKKCSSRTALRRRQYVCTAQHTAHECRGSWGMQPKRDGKREKDSSNGNRLALLLLIRRICLFNSTDLTGWVYILRIEKDQLVILMKSRQRTVYSCFFLAFFLSGKYVFFFVFLRIISEQHRSRGASLFIEFSPTYPRSYRLCSWYLSGGSKQRVQTFNRKIDEWGRYSLAGVSIIAEQYWPHWSFVYIFLMHFHRTTWSRCENVSRRESLCTSDLFLSSFCIFGISPSDFHCFFRCAMNIWNAKISLHKN